MALPVYETRPRSARLSVGSRVAAQVENRTSRSLPVESMCRKRLQLGPLGVRGSHACCLLIDATGGRGQIFCSG